MLVRPTFRRHWMQPCPRDARGGKRRDAVVVHRRETCSGETRPSLGSLKGCVTRTGDELGAHLFPSVRNRQSFFFCFFFSLSLSLSLPSTFLFPISHGPLVRAYPLARVGREILSLL
ncbi:hypothetical protein LY76DRAFT_228216 [Colletotrichum caudatum]|nr:hypothetical protein LY76DRAFT_228216 [Colletotrichum caudatum]